MKESEHKQEREIEREGDCELESSADPLRLAVENCKCLTLVLS